MNSILHNIIRFFVVVLVQVLLIDQMPFSIYIRPAFYIYFLLCLPISSPRWLELILGFVLGLTIDVFSNTLGLHAFCCVFVSYLRPYLIQLFVNEEDRKSGMTPSLSLFGWNTYLKISGILLLVQHFLLFSLEMFSFVGWWQTLLRILLSSLFCLIFILLVELVKVRSNNSSFR